MSASLRLESFAPIGARSLIVTYVQGDIDAAYSAGFNAGRSEQEDNQIACLSKEFSRLTDAIYTKAALTVDHHRHAVEIFSPVLVEILSLISSKTFAPKIEAAICSVIAEVAIRDSIGSCHITCPPQLIDSIKRSIPNGKEDIFTIERSENGDSTISLDESRISIDRSKMVSNLTEIIREILEEDDK